MTTFEDFLHDLDDLVQEHAGHGLALRMETDAKGGIAKIFSENATSLIRASNGLADAVDLAHTAAEHHPLWSLLDSSAEISATVLEKWNDDLSVQDVEEIKWRIKTLARSAEGLLTSNSSHR